MDIYVQMHYLFVRLIQGEGRHAARSRGPVRPSLRGESWGRPCRCAVDPLFGRRFNK